MQSPRLKDLTDPKAIPQPEYRRRFHGVLSVFGRENVVFEKFSKDVIQDSGVDHFCRLVGIPDGKVTDSQTNESLPLEAVGLIHDFNLNGPVTEGTQKRVAARRRLFRVLGGLYETRFQIPADLIAAHLDLEDIEWMEKTGGFDLRPAPSELTSSARGTLKDYVTPISKQTIKILKGHLRKKGIDFARDDSPAQLVTHLYNFILLKVGQRAKAS